MKKTITNYTFDASARTITFTDYTSIDIERITLITNVTDNIIIYQFNSPSNGGSALTNVLTLDYDTTSMSDTDDLQIFYEDDTPITDGGMLGVGNARKKFRDGFALPFVGGVPDPTVWTTTNTDGHLITQGGNSSGASYLRITLDPRIEDSEVTITSVETFKMPIRYGYGLSMSQRISGQEVFIGAVADDGNGHIDTSTTPIADFSLATATVTVASNVATVTLPAGSSYPFTGGDRINVYGFVDNRMNVGPVVVTASTKYAFTFPVTIANGTYPSTNAYIRYADPLRYAYNGAGYLFGDNTTTTNGSYYTRRNGSRFRGILNQTISTVTASQTNTNAYTDAFNTASVYENEIRLEELAFRSFSSDSMGAMAGTQKISQGIPDDDEAYHLHVRARNMKGMTRPVAAISSISKSGSTTATVTTATPHGLATGNYVQIYGVRDQTNFANLTTAAAITVTGANTFTVVLGASVTASSAGGGVFVYQGSVSAPGAYSQVVQSISQVDGVVYLVGNGTWATPLPGEMVLLYGLDSATSKEGFYKVLRVNTSTLELQPITNPSQADFTSINTGGAVIKPTDVRLHFARVLDYSRLVTEVVGGRGAADQNNSVPVYISGGTPGTTAVTQSTGANTTAWNAAGWGGFLVNDIASAALTTTTTTTAVTPGSLATIGTYAHSFHIAVTAVSGTNQTLDVVVQESVDNGTNWVDVYHFQRITATGSYQSPLIRAAWGTRYRYVQTVAGTSPSFTRSLNRLQFSSNPPLLRQFVDRSITLTTLSSTTPTFFVDGIDSAQLTFNVGAIVTTAPQLQLEGSEDASTWYSIGTPLTAVASSTVVTNYSGIMPKFIRARVSTAGVGVTAGYVQIKGTGR